MNELFGPSVATLQRAQRTMDAQLERLGRALFPDPVRLPRLRSDAQLFGRAAAILVDRIWQSEPDLDLVQQTRALMAWFESAEQRAALLLRRQSDAGSNAAQEDDDEAHTEADSPRTSEEPSRAASHRSSAAARLALRRRGLDGRTGQLGHSGQQPGELPELRVRRLRG